MIKIIIPKQCHHCGCELWFQENSINKNYRYENKTGFYYCLNHQWKEDRK